MNLHEWQNVARDGSVRVLKYSFGPGSANTLAAKLDDGTWVVISPCASAPGAALDALAKDGEVSALVAPNGYHHMGQAVWRARFPKAVSYAPEGAIERLGKKSAGVPYRPLADLSAKLPARVRFCVPEGMKVPDVLAKIGAPEGPIWFSGDLISNTVDDDLSFLPRLIVGLLGGGAGYRVNPVPALVYVKDKAGWRASVRKLMDDGPIAAVVPAHGLPVTDDVLGRTRAMLG